MVGDTRHLGHRQHLVADLRPLVDRDHTLARPLHDGILDHTLIAGAQWPRHLIRRQQLDLRLRGQDALDEVRLQSRQHRRHEDDHADADRDAADDEQRLQTALAQEADRRDPSNGSQRFTATPDGRAGPVRTPELTRNTSSPSAKPSMISTWLLPRSPSRTGCLTARPSLMPSTQGWPESRVMHRADRQRSACRSSRRLRYRRRPSCPGADRPAGPPRQLDLDRGARDVDAGIDID